jgi:ketosteroid isomerase-like protein
VYRLAVKRMVRRAYRQLSRGDYESVLKTFTPGSRFRFAGTHALGGERIGTEAVREWFEEVFRVFPDLQLEPETVVVGGWPWNTVAATRFHVRATLLDGHPYSNEGMQLLRIRWGRVVEDFLYEDTQRIAAALDRMAA